MWRTTTMLKKYDAQLLAWQAAHKAASTSDDPTTVDSNEPDGGVSPAPPSPSADDLAGKKSGRSFDDTISQSGSYW